MCFSVIDLFKLKLYRSIPNNIHQVLYAMAAVSIGRRHPKMEEILKPRSSSGHD